VCVPILCFVGRTYANIIGDSRESCLLHTTMLHCLLLERYLLKKNNTAEFNQVNAIASFIPLRIPVPQTCTDSHHTVTPGTCVRVSSTTKEPRLFGRISMSASPMERSQRSINKAGQLQQEQFSVSSSFTKRKSFWYEFSTYLKTPSCSPYLPIPCSPSQLPHSQFASLVCSRIGLKCLQLMTWWNTPR
jgi:hypothetical protein